MTFALAGRTVLIAGASSGIGAHFARVLVAAGASVALGARRFERVAALAGELGENALPVALDVTDEASVAAAYDATEARFGTVNGVVANAGIGTGGRATDIPADALRGLTDTNLLGAMLVAREGARRMIASGSAAREDGRIVLIGSITAERAGLGDALYAATKAGLAHLARNLAREWIRLGVNVNTLQPGIIPTEANTAWFASERGAADVAAQHRRRLLDGDALDDMLLFLLSDRSRQVTGATFTIDDGQSL